MPTRSKTTRSTSRARKTTRTARARSSSRKGALPAVTVAARQIKDTVNEVRKDPRKLKNIGKAAAVAAGVITAGMLLKKR